MDSEEEDAVLSHRRLRSVDTLETVVAWYGADSWQKRAVSRPQLGNSDALASGPADSPVELRTDVSHWVAKCGLPK